MLEWRYLDTAKEEKAENRDENIQMMLRNAQPRTKSHFALCKCLSSKNNLVIVCEVDITKLLKPRYRMRSKVRGEVIGCYCVYFDISLVNSAFNKVLVKWGISISSQFIGTMYFSP